MTEFTAKLSILIDASKEKVWEALTNPDIVKKYFYGTTLITDWKVGSRIIFRGEWQGKTYEDKGEILEFIPNQKLVYNYWSTMSGLPDKPELYQILTYELKEENNGITVSIIQQNLDSEKRMQHAEESWEPVLQGLKKIVEEGI
jgi:uncharacterized protein YndB with AHSA1/START domain